MDHYDRGRGDRWHLVEDETIGTPLGDRSVADKPRPTNHPLRPVFAVNKKTHQEKVVAHLGIKLQGHLKIREYETLDDYQQQRKLSVLLNQRNAVHKDNAAILIGFAMTNRLNSAISYMFFGNGGATLTDTGTFTPNPPNVTDSANLYHPTFFKLVDDRRGATPGNSMSIRHINGTQFSDTEIRCLIAPNEPFGQLGRDEVGNLITAPFVFNEIGLKGRDGRLITHVTFTPVVKHASRILEVVYTIRLAVGNPVVEVVSPAIELIGVEAVSEVGSLGPVDTLLLAGVQATAQAGTVRHQERIGIAGAEATAQVGTFGPVDTRLMVGGEATAEVGSLGLVNDHGLAGVQVTAQVGTFVPSSPSSNDILREDGSYVLREDDSKIEREHEGP